MLKIIRTPKNPLITLFIPITRWWTLDRFLPHLDEIDMPWDQTEIFFYIDTDEQRIINRIIEFINLRSEKYNGSKIVVSGNPAPTNTRISVQRERIVEMKEKSKHDIKGSYIFGIEDDTLVPKNAFVKMYVNLTLDYDIGYIEGVQVGRHGLKMVGAWRQNKLKNPTIQQTLEPPKFDNLEPITGGGFYCYLTLAYLYEKIKYRYEAECFGPDVCFVNDVLKEEYKAYIDWSIKTVHMTPKQDLLVDDKIISAVWKKENSGWQLQSYQNK